MRLIPEVKVALRTVCAGLTSVSEVPNLQVEFTRVFSVVYPRFAIIKNVIFQL